MGTRRALLALSVVGLIGCYDQVTVPDTDSDGRASVINDEATLAERVRHTDEDIPIDSSGATPATSFEGAAAPPMRAPSSVSLTLIADVSPPLLDDLGIGALLGERAQAAAISRRTSGAFLVSYNFQGAPYVGGVDYIINWFGFLPSIASSILFSDSDVAAVEIDGSSVYAVQATDATGFATPAAIERIRLSFFGMSLLDLQRQDLSSFAATSVLTVGDVVYVTTGDDGHLYALDEDDLSVLAQYPLDDARWVAHDEDEGRLVVVQGTPGRIALFEEGNFPGGAFNLLDTYPFPGADVPESKSTVEISGGKAFIAAGPDGVQVMCLDDGEIVGVVPRPDPGSLGLDPSVVVTNAVTVDDDLMFISNGEAGVYVAAGEDDWADTGCAGQSIGVLGQLQFGELESVNHVDYRSNVLFVAAGLGGVKIVRVSVTP